MGRWLLAGSVALAVTVPFLASVTPALAHAIIVESSPKAGEVVSRAPRGIVLRFNTRIEKNLSRVTLTGPGAHSRASLQPLPDPEPDRLAVWAPFLEPGAYLVRWKVLSADGHVTQGILRFTLAPER